MHLEEKIVKKNKKKRNKTKQNKTNFEQFQ